MPFSVRKWLNAQEKDAVAYRKDPLLTLKCHKMLVSTPECIFNILYFKLFLKLFEKFFSKN